MLGRRIIVSDFLAILPIGLRRRVYFVAPAIAIVALVELASVAIAVPFFTVVVKAESILKNPEYSDFLAIAEISTEGQLLATSAFVFCTIVALSALIRFLLYWFQTGLAFEIGRYLGCSIYDASLWQPYEKILENNSDEVISTLSFKVERSVKDIILPSFLFLTSCVSLAAIGVVLAAISLKVTVALVLGLGFIYFAIRMVTKGAVIESGGTIAQKSTSSIKIAREGYLGFRDIILGQSRQFYSDLFVTAYSNFKKAQFKVALLAALPRYLVEGVVLVSAGLTVFIFSVGEEGFVSVLPLLSAFGIGAMRSLPLVQGVYNSLTTISAGLVNLRETMALLDRSDSELMKSNHVSQLPISFENQIELKNVSFRYAGTSEWVLRGINMIVKKGSHIGIIGQSGGGKSTLLSIMMGFLQPTEGEILVDGKVLSPLHNTSWQRKIAHVPQNIFLLDSTIAENIAFGQKAKDIDLSILSDVIERASMTEVVSGKPDGVWSQVGENGINLSGGQRQRLAIARAYYRGAELIFLDEATSALDQKTEVSALQWMSNKQKGTTIIKVAHRVNTLESCDAIFRLKEGNIEEVID